MELNKKVGRELFYQIKCLAKSIINLYIFIIYVDIRNLRFFTIFCSKNFIDQLKILFSI